MDALEMLILLVTMMSAERERYKKGASTDLVGLMRSMGQSAHAADWWTLQEKQ